MYLYDTKDHLISSYRYNSVTYPKIFTRQSMMIIQNGFMIMCMENVQI